MKFFDRDFLFSNISDEESELRIQEYIEQKCFVEKHADYNIRLLLSSISLHDAKILVIKKELNCLIIILSCGDNQVGHFRLTLSFDKNSKIDLFDNVLPFTVVYYEIDYNDNYYTISFISNDAKTFDIQFNTVSLFLEAEKK